MTKNQNSYWAEREKDYIDDRIKSDKDFAKELTKYYTSTVDEIEKQIDHFYTSYASSQGITKKEAQARVSQHDVAAFEKTAARLVKAKDFSAEANTQLKLYNATMKINRMEMLKSQVAETLVGLGATEEQSVQKYLDESYRDEVTRRAGILGRDVSKDLLNNARTVVNGSWQGAIWSDRIWANNNELRAVVGTQLNRFMTLGFSNQDIARQIMPQLRETITNRVYAAERIARTESARVQDLASTANDKKYGVKYQQWIAEPSACKKCKSLVEQNETGLGKGVYKIDDAPAIPAHPDCRCAKAPFVPEGTMEKLIAKANAERDSESIQPLALDTDFVNRGKEKLGSIDVSAVRNALTALNKVSYSGPESKFDGQYLRAMYKLAGSVGFDKKPMFISTSDFKKLPSNTKMVRWTDRADNLLHGPLEYSSNRASLKGRSIYFSTDTESTAYDRPGRQRVDAALSKDAVIVDYRHLVEKVRSIIANEELDFKMRPFRGQMLFDIVAAQNGIDGWYETSQKYMMIVNRGKLVIRDDE